MHDLGFFEIFAECSIAFAGFGAVHAVLRGATGARGMFRAWSVVANGALCFLLSILPLLLALASPSAAVLWRSASAIALAGTIATCVSTFGFDIQLTRLGHPPRSHLVIRVSKSLSVIALLAMLANLIGWPWPPGPFAYAVGLTLLLITGLVALLISFLVPLEIVLAGADPNSPETRFDD